MLIKIIFQPTEESTKLNLDTVIKDVASTIKTDIQNG